MGLLEPLQLEKEVEVVCRRLECISNILGFNEQSTVIMDDKQDSYQTCQETS